MSTKQQKRSIFRTEAVEGYIAAREKSIWPRFIRPSVFLFLWILLGLLLVAGALTWLAQVPVYAQGTALVTELNGQSSQDEVGVIAFLLPPALEQLESGQTMFLIMGEDDRLPLSISKVEPQVLSPETVRKQFELTEACMGLISGPVAVIQATPPTEVGGFPISTYVGTVYGVEVEVGVRRIVSLIPYIGQFFEAQF